MDTRKNVNYMTFFIILSMFRFESGEGGFLTCDFFDCFFLSSGVKFWHAVCRIPTQEGSNMKKCRFCLNIFLGLVLVALWGCGSTTSGSGRTSSGGTSGGGTTTVDPDLSNVDTTKRAASASISAGLSASKSVGKGASVEEEISVAKASAEVSAAFGTDSGDNSIAGCEARQLFDEGVRISKEVSIFLCYLTACRDNIPECIVSEPEFNNLRFNFGTGKAGLNNAGYSMKVRGKTVGDTQTIHVCEGDKQNESFVFTTNNDSRTVTFKMKHHFTSAQDGGEDKDYCDSNGDGSISDAERASCRSGGNFDEWGDLSGTVVFDAAASGKIDAISEFDSANVTGIFNGNFGTGSLTVVYDEDGSPSGGEVNKAKGGFANSFGAGDSGTGFMYAEFNSSQGSAKFSHTGTMPHVPAGFIPTHLQGTNYCPNFSSCDPGDQFDTAGCKVATPAASCYCITASTASGCTLNESGTEHFTISLDSKGKPVFKIASTSIFASNVAAETLPTSVTSLAKNFGDESWDCNANAYTEIDLADESIFASCIAMEDDAFNNSDRDTCFQDTGESFCQEGTKELQSLGLSVE